MATPRKPGGYEWKHQIARAKGANRAARHVVQLILEEHPSPTMIVAYLAGQLIQLGITDEALDELERIAGRSDHPTV